MNIKDAIREDEKLAKYYELKTGRQLYHVERVEFRQSDEFGGFGYLNFVEIELSSIISTEGSLLWLKFFNVSDFRFNSIHGKELSFGELLVIPSGLPSQERTPYKVNDLENDSISFYCVDFIVELR